VALGQIFQETRIMVRRSAVFALVACLCLAAWPALAARAGVIVTLTQEMGNVVASGSGTIDLTDLSFVGGADGVVPIRPIGAEIGIGPATPNGSGALSIYTGYIGPSNFGSGGITVSNSGSGDPVTLWADPNWLYVPVGYVSGSPLSGSATWDGQTFASLGVTPGTYVWTWGSGAHADSFTLQVGPAAALPEPSTLVLFGLLTLGGVVYCGWRRRKLTAA
jgi:hypothetical protein